MKAGIGRWLLDNRSLIILTFEIFWIAVLLIGTGYQYEFGANTAIYLCKLLGLIKRSNAYFKGRRVVTQRGSIPSYPDHIQNVVWNG